MSEITNLLIALGNINVTNKTLLMALVIVLAVLLYKLLDDRKFNRYYNDMKSEKNKEIERLADDNRRYRDIYLNSLGINQEQINNMTAANMKGE